MTRFTVSVASSLGLHDGAAERVGKRGKRLGSKWAWLFPLLQTNLIKRGK